MPLEKSGAAVVEVVEVVLPLEPTLVEEAVVVAVLVPWLDLEDQEE